MNNHNYCVIMAGGIGSRFWPVSREDKPKQFLSLSPDGKSFLRLAYDRFSKIVPADHVLVVSQVRYEEMVRETLPEVPDENIILEPLSRNTAPCIALAAFKLLLRDSDAVMVATPADHIILDEEIFEDTIRKALDYAADSDALITLGIVPDRPDTNFGYIQGVTHSMEEDGKPVKVKTFTEKPDKDLAEVFFQSGEFFWNSGIFVWRAQTIRDELAKHMPEVEILFRGWESELGTPGEVAFLERAYSSISKISIDYAVMEKTDKAWVFPAKFKWADIGNWESLYEYLAQHDSFGNASDIDGKSLLREGRDNIIYSDGKGKLIAIRGLEDYIVIDTDDVLLICPRDEKKLKEFLSELAMPEYADYR